MLRKERNLLIVDNWTLCQVDYTANPNVLNVFDCGDPDLNEYFQQEAPLNVAELISQPYYLHESSSKETVVALIDLCNDAVRKESSKRQPGYRDVVELNEAKQFPFLPAVKLTRIGVAKEFQRHNLGSHLLNMIKQLFLTENRTGCRFLTVDAYNKPEVINFYEKNDFKLFYDKDRSKETRSMFFDLKRLIL